MKHGKRDANHGEIKAAFEQLGCSVHDTADMGGGFPDLAVGLCGVSTLVEVKQKDGTLTPAQELFVQTWRGRLSIVRSVDDVITVVQEIRREVKGS